eukprot:1982621-Heterocapsa_arctica.AAC.1
MGAIGVDWLGEKTTRVKGGQNYHVRVNYRMLVSQQPRTPKPVWVPKLKYSVVCLNCGGHRWARDCSRPQSARKSAGAGTTGRSAVRQSEPSASR